MHTTAVCPTNAIQRYTQRQGAVSSVDKMALYSDPAFFFLRVLAAPIYPPRRAAGCTPGRPSLVIDNEQPPGPLRGERSHGVHLLREACLTTFVNGRHDWRAMFLWFRNTGEDHVDHKDYLRQSNLPYM